MKRTISKAFLALCLASIAGTAAAAGAQGVLGELLQAALQGGSRTAPAGEGVEYAFSPNDGAEQLVLKVINSSQKELRVMAYSLTAAPVIRALIAAKKRGVDVAVLADHKQNVDADHSGKGRAALSALVNAGVEVRTIRAYAIYHQKVILRDGVTLETGSYNFSAAAAKSNSENVLVLWHNPQAVAGYRQRFEHDWRLGMEYRPAY